MFYELHPAGIRLFVKVSPKASSNAIRGVENMDGDKQVLKVSVTVVPEEGKANQAVIQLLSKALHLAKSHISLQQGETSRWKTFWLEDVSPAVIAQLESYKKP